MCQVMEQRVYGLQDLPGGESDETVLSMLPNRSVILVVMGQDPSRIGRIVVWEDEHDLHAAFLDVDGRPLRRRVVE